ncbi:MAG: NADH:ubiquinone reductase (Na(+)-transporting) subunit B, partial [Paludibacteraceae bacterium]|nr:NADH:ubiquinone reductase (Na(+)-transporting) subunit B [Paludibacteraceae bacterium]
MEKFYQIWKKFGKNFEEGGRFEKLSSFYDAFDTFLFTPTTTAKRVGAQIHDGSDSKRTMILVVLALIPCALFGMFNVGYQHLLATGQLAMGMTCALWWKALGFGVLAVLPFYLVSYIVGLGIEFIVAQIKHEEVAEGYLVTGFILPLILPINTPLWQVAVATAFAVIFAKEVFGGTGYNIFNVALIARAFLFFAYPSSMTGDSVFVRTGSTWGWDGGAAVDGWTGATTLTQMSTGAMAENATFWDVFNGLMPGCVGETCVWAILLGAILLLVTGVASWKVMLSIVATAGITAALFNAFGPDSAIANYPWYMQLISGGLLFGAVFMATDPVTGARTECGKWIYGALIGFIVILVRVLNPGYPEGMMLAILLGNAFAPLIDWCVVRRNVKRRMN